MINLVLTILLTQPIAKSDDWTIYGDLARKEAVYTALYDPKLENWATDTLRTGDLIFRKGEVYIAGIFNFSQFTCDITDSIYSHVGIVYCFADKTYVFELGPAGTEKKPLSLFLQESVGRRVLIQRINPAYTDRIPTAMAYVWTQYMRNTPFDFDFRLKNGKLYCAEMVIESFKISHILLAKPIKAGDLPGVTDHILKTLTVVGGSYFFSNKPFDANMSIFTVGDIIKSKYLDKVFEGKL